MSTKNSVTYWHHSVALIAIFILGNTLMKFPSGSDAHSGIYALLLILAPSLVVYCLYSKLTATGTKNLLDNKCAKWLAIPIIILSAFSLSICSRDYTLFIDTMRLPNTSMYVIVALLLALGFLLGLKDKKVIYLFSLVGIVFVAVILLLMFIFSIPNMNFEYLSVLLKPDVPAAFRQGAGIFINSLGQGIILVFFIDKAKKPLKQQYSGLFIGAVFLLLSFFCVLSVLGALASRVDYPYIAVTEMISFGRGFTRMEGFSYGVYFICVLIKVAVLINVSITAAQALGPRVKKSMYILLPLVSIYGVSNAGEGLFQGSAINIFMLILQLLLPVALLLVSAFKKL